MTNLKSMFLGLVIALLAVTSIYANDDDNELLANEAVKSTGELKANEEKLKRGIVEVYPGYYAPLIEPVSIQYPEEQRRLESESSIAIVDGVINVVDLLHDGKTFWAIGKAWPLVGLTSDASAKQRKLKNRHVWKDEAYDGSLLMLNNVFKDSKNQKIDPKQLKTPEGKAKFRKLTDTLFQGVKDIITVSPMGPYLAWDKAVIDGRPLGDLAVEIATNFRALKYNAIMSVAGAFVTLIAKLKNSNKSTEPNSQFSSFQPAYA